MARFLLLVWLTGCGGASVAPPISNATAVHDHASAIASAAAVKHIFLSDAVYNVVVVFDRNGTTRTLTGFEEPQLLATDHAANLYVANTIDENVEVFSPPYRNKPTRTMPDQGEWPVDVAVAKDGTVAIVNICQAMGSQCGAPGSVYFFTNSKSTSPCATVSGGTTISRTLAAAFDSSGTLYVDGVNAYTTSRVGVIAGECNATKLMALQPDAAIHFAAGLAVDPNGNVAIVDSGGPTRGTLIDVFAPPKAGSKKLNIMSQNALYDSTVVASFALSKDGAHLYTAEPHYALEYAYPQGGSSEAQVTPPKYGDLIEGVAVTPAEVP